jgi:hypothetical protein
MDLKPEQAARLLGKVGFVTKFVTPPDKVYFGNWTLTAVQGPLALRVTNDRGVVLDLMEWDTFQAGADESEWFNWDVVARALGIPGEGVEDQLYSFLVNLNVVEDAFLRPNWPMTRDLLHKIEAEKRRRFMEGGGVPAHA